MEAEDGSRKRAGSSLEESSLARPAKKPRNPSTVLIGSLVRKSFPAEGTGAPPTTLLGKVLSCCGRQYTIVFEDGRREALNIPETRQILLGEEDAEGLLASKSKLEDLCRSIPVNAPRTRSRRIDARENPSVSVKSRKKVCSLADGAESGKESQDASSDVAKKDASAGVVLSLSVPSSNLEEGVGADSCSDSCDSVHAGGLVSTVEQTTSQVPLMLPPSSGDIDVPENVISHLFNVYNFLRSFSHLLFLSPFTLDDFVASLNFSGNSSLMDSVHLSLLRTLKRHLESLESDGSKLACMCLKCIDWNLLDVITWPLFLVRYFSIVGHIKLVDGEVFLAGALDGEYHYLPVAVKLEVLQILCDDVLESSELGMELASRENMDEVKEIDGSTDLHLLEGGPKRVHPRYAKTSACKTPGSLDETITEDALNPDTKGVESDAKDLNVGQDGNSDYCRLCGMEGTLVCCDGCPSAYHSRCIGLNKAHLPEGPWFCPECTVSKIGMTSSRISFGIRGAELFGSDSFGRMFFGTCGYLVVLDDYMCKGKHMARYYNQSDITKVLQAFCSTREASSSYVGICKAMLTYWEIPSALDSFQHLRCADTSLTDATFCQRTHHTSPTEGKGEDQGGGTSNFNEEDQDLPLQDNSYHNMPIANNTSIGIDNSSLGSASIFKGLISAEDPENKFPFLQQKFSEDPGIIVCNGHLPGDESSKSAGESNLLSDACNGCSRTGTNLIRNHPSTFKPYEYINQYIPGEVAASAAANYAIAAAERNKILENNPSIKERKNLAPISAVQLKSFSEASMHFPWPGTDKKIFEVLRERCGWCLACETAVSCKRGCLLNAAVMNTLKGCSKAPGSFRQLKSEQKISSIAAYIMYMESSLGGLLVGPFLDVYHNVQWRKALAEASTIQLLKYLLLEFERNIRGVAFLNDWLKPVDDWSIDGSILQNGAFLASKRGLRGRRGRKRSVVESNISDSDDDHGQIQWCSGGRLSEVVLRRGALPAPLVKKAARHGGIREISGIFYNLKVPSTTRQSTWRAAVEKSKNDSQLAFQVRCLDSHLRWRDLSRPDLTSLDGKMSDVEASTFRNVIIIDEKVVGNHIRYALAFGDQKHLPVRIMKNVLETEQCADGDKLWFSENFLPLYLIKEYENSKTKFCMPPVGKDTNWPCIVPRTQQNSVQEDIFSYLFHRNENPGKSSCSSCKRDVLLRYALRCQNCGGPCHRDCLKASATDMTTCVCTACCNLIPLKKDVGDSKVRLSTEKCEMASQFDVLLPKIETGEQLSFCSSQKPANIKKNSKRTPGSANINSQKKNQCVNYGLIFKTRKGIDIESFDPDFQTKKIIRRGDVEMGTHISPQCKLCLLPYNPNLMYICCEKCGSWYHAESLELVEHKVGELVGFRCPPCRRRCCPICPYADPDPSSRRRQMRRNGMDGKGNEIDRKQHRTATIVSQASSELLATNLMQSGQVKLEYTVPPERIEHTSVLMSDAPLHWSPPKAVMSSKGKLPVRRHTSSDIFTDTDAGYSELIEEPGMPSNETANIEQVDLQGFSSFRELDSTISVDQMYIKPESDFKAADSNMDVGDVDGNYQLFGSDNGGTEVMEYEPQTYFSFTELLASGEEQDVMFDVDIPVEVPDDWQPPNDWGPSEPLGFDVPSGVVVPPTYSGQIEVPMHNRLACKKCGSDQPLPDLACEICGLTIHSHCSPWVEMENLGSGGQWRCGGCREWR